MPAPLFTTNPAEFTRLEGLYIFEQDPPAFIRGVDLGVVGIFGRTLKGPVDKAVEITSESRFIEVFGADRHAVGGGAILNDVWKEMLNKPFGKLVIVRAAASAAVAASLDAEDGTGGVGVAILRIAASSPGIWGNDVAVEVVNATDGDVNHFNLEVTYKGATTTYKNLNVFSTSDNTATVVGSDDGRLITLTKLAAGRPANFSTIVETNWEANDNADDSMNLGKTLTAYSTVAGTDGTIATSDYTAANRAFDKIKEYKGVSLVLMADGGVQATIASVNATMKTQALIASDRMFLMWYGSFGQTVATVVADAASFRSDRVIYCYNDVTTLDPEAAVNVETAPHSWMASIMSQTDVDIHPGEEATKRFTGGIKSLRFEGMAREDYVSLRSAGIAALEKDAEGGFVFVSGVVTDLTPGKTEITRRRMADFLQLSVANRLKFFVKKKNTTENRIRMGGEVTAFLNGLKSEGRIVEDFEVDQESQNTLTSRGEGKEFILMRVRLIGHMLFLILKTEIGTGVTIEAG